MNGAGFNVLLPLIFIVWHAWIGRLMDRYGALRILRIANASVLRLT